jgi:hypothetical protein
MSVRISTARVLGAALALGMSATAAIAQNTGSTGMRDSMTACRRDSTGTLRDSLGTQRDSTWCRTNTRRAATSSTRIPIRKEGASTGDVAPTPAPPPPPPPAPPPEAVVAVPVPVPVPVPDTVKETVVAVVPAPPPPMPARRFNNGFYVGVAGGPTVPTGDLRDGYNTGYNVTVPIGWDAPMSPFGLRLDLGYDRLNGRTLVVGPATLTNNDPQIWSAVLNAKLRVPFRESSHLYVFGGGGAFHFRDFAGPTASTTVPSGVTGTFIPARENVTRGGVDGGVGLAFGLGPANLFVESRYVRAFTKGTRSNFIPIVLGLSFY